VGLERGPLSLVSINEELLGKKLWAPAYKTEINGGGDPLRLPSDTAQSAKVGTPFADEGHPSFGTVSFRAKGNGDCIFVRNK
jgi:hypothetical protein